MTASVIARAVLVVAAVSAAIALAAWQSSEEGCTDSVKAMFVDLRDRAPEPQLAASVERVEAECPGSSRLVDSGAVLLREGHPQLAAALLEEAVAREPESFSAWAGLASVLAEADPARSAEAGARAERLNPRYRPPS